MLDAATFNCLVTIESRSSSQDAAGQPVLTWSEVAQVWASIQNLSGVATLKTHADADMSITRTSIRIRWLAGLTAGMRVVHGSNVYDIKSVLYDMVGRQYVDLVCHLGGADG